MQCPRCFSADLDTTARCPCCGIQLSVREERALLGRMPLPARTPVLDEFSPANVEEAVA